MKPHAAALLLFTAVLAFYLYTLQPSLAWGDGTRLQREVVTAESFILAEMVDVPFAPDPLPFARLGVAAWDHPLYVILGHALVRALPGVDPLWLVNAVSAVFGAGAIALIFLWIHANTRSLPASLFAALALAVSHTFWWHAVTPEVYTLFAFLLLLAVYSFDRYERHGRFRDLLLAAFALGVGASNHLLAFLALPALALYLLLARKSPRALNLTAIRLFWLVLAFLLGFAPYLVQLLRLLRTFPPEMVMGPAVGATFLRGSLATTPALLLQSLVGYLIFLVYQFNPLGVLLGAYGWWIGRRAYPVLWAKAVALYAVYLLFALVYRVADQFAFFLAAHVFWAVALGMGTAVLLDAAQSFTAARRRALGLLLAASVLLMPLLYAGAPRLLRAVGIDEAAFGVPQVGNGVRDGLAYYVNPNKRGDTAAAAFGRETLQRLPPDAVVLAAWYVDTDEYFVLRYFAVVEGMRPDVALVGWPTVDPFTFDPALAREKIAADLPQRPVYLASLSEEFYDARTLLTLYCVQPEDNLYRIYSRSAADEQTCLPPSAAQTLP